MKYNNKSRKFRRTRPSNKNKPSYNPPKQRPFTDTLFNHAGWIGTGEFEREWNDDLVKWEQVEKEEWKEHWGRKEYCKNCELAGKIGKFDNRWTARGWLLFFWMPIVFLVIAGIIAS